MERKLSAALAVAAQPTVVLRVEAARTAEALPDEASEAVGIAPAPAMADRPERGSLFGDDAPWPTDESSESAFLADARARGEGVAPVRATAQEEAVEVEASPLPPLDDLVQRIPAEVRELLDELYRVKFTAVRRVPANALK